MTDEPTHVITLSDSDYKTLLDMLREGSERGDVHPKTAEAILLAVAQGHRALAANSGLRQAQPTTNMADHWSQHERGRTLA